MGWFGLFGHFIIRRVTWDSFYGRLQFYYLYFDITLLLGHVCDACNNVALTGVWGRSSCGKWDWKKGCINFNLSSENHWIQVQALCFSAVWLLIVHYLQHWIRCTQLNHFVWIKCKLGCLHTEVFSKCFLLLPAKSNASLGVYIACFGISSFLSKRSVLVSSPLAWPAAHLMCDWKLPWSDCTLFFFFLPLGLRGLSLRSYNLNLTYFVDLMLMLPDLVALTLTLCKLAGVAALLIQLHILHLVLTANSKILPLRTHTRFLHPHLSRCRLSMVICLALFRMAF